MMGTGVAQGWHRVPTAVWGPLARWLVEWSECSEVWGGLGVPVCSPGLEMALGACWRVARVYRWWHPPVMAAWPLGAPWPGVRQPLVGTSRG